MLKNTGDFILNLNQRCLGGPKMKTAKVITRTSCCGHRHENVPYQGGCDSFAADWRLFTPAEMSLPVSTPLCKQLHLSDHAPAQSKPLPSRLRTNHKPEGKKPGFPRAANQTEQAETTPTDQSHEKYLQHLQLCALHGKLLGTYSRAWPITFTFYLFPARVSQNWEMGNIKYIMYNSCYGKCHYVCCLMRFPPEHCQHVLNSISLPCPVLEKDGEWFCKYFFPANITDFTVHKN